MLLGSGSGPPCRRGTKAFFAPVQPVQVGVEAGDEGIGDQVLGERTVSRRVALFLAKSLQLREEGMAVSVDHDAGAGGVLGDEQDLHQQVISLWFDGPGPSIEPLVQLVPAYRRDPVGATASRRIGVVVGVGIDGLVLIVANDEPVTFQAVERRVHLPAVEVPELGGAGLEGGPQVIAVAGSVGQ